jgi:hypothetical protein
MKFRYSLRTLLLVVAAVACVLPCLQYLYSRYELQSRRRQTLQGLNWSGGTEADRLLVDRAREALRASTYSSLHKPKLVTVSAFEDPDRSYCVVVDWISQAPNADGIQITFTDGTTTNIRLNEAYLSHNQSTSSEVVLFQGVVRRNELPTPANQKTLDDLVTVALLSGDRVCSNSLPVEHY